MADHELNEPSKSGVWAVYYQREMDVVAGRVREFYPCCTVDMDEEAAIIRVRHKGDKIMVSVSPLIFRGGDRQWITDEVNRRLKEAHRG